MYLKIQCILSLKKVMCGCHCRRIPNSSTSELLEWNTKHDDNCDIFRYW